MNQNIIEVSKQKARQICSDNRDFYQNILKGAALVGTKPNSIVRNCIAAPVAECSALPINNNVRPHTNCPIQGL